MIMPNEFLTANFFSMIFIMRDLMTYHDELIQLYNDLDHDINRIIDLTIDDSRDNSLADDFMNDPAMNAFFSRFDDDESFLSLREIADAMTDDEFENARILITNSIYAIINSRDDNYNE